jgi:death on curing protein
VSTYYLVTEDLIAIHEVATGYTENYLLLVDAGLLASAVARPQAIFGGHEFYVTIWEKAAALMESIARNHAFTDGNKRTAWMACWTFLGLNGHDLDRNFDRDPVARRAAFDLVLAVVERRIDIAGCASELVKFAE